MSSLRSIGLLFAACFAFGLAGCDSSSDAPVASVRVLHAVADAPRVNVYLDNNQVLTDVDFRQGSEYLSVVSGEYDVRVEAIIPGGNQDIITVPDFDFAPNSSTTLAAVGAAAQVISALPLDEPTTEVGAGNIRLRVTHASPDAQPVYLAVTTPDAPIDQAALLGPLSFQQTSQDLEVPAGDYQIRVTLSAQPVTDNDVVYDSGTLSLADGDDLHAFAVTSTVPSTAASASPVSVVVLNGQGSFDVFDTATGANLRVVHNSPGAPGVDVFVDLLDTQVVEDAQIVTNLTYGNSVGYITPAVAATNYNVGVRVNPNQAPDVLNFDADLMAGMGYTVIANDEVSSIVEWVLVDDYRSVITESKVRIAHGSPSAGIVDIYVLKSADNLLPQDVAEATLEDIEFGQETGFLSLEPDTYDIYVTAANGTTPAISVEDLAITAGGVYTAIARDPDPLDAMDTELNVILIADEP